MPDLSITEQFSWTNKQHLHDVIGSLYTKREIAKKAFPNNTFDECIKTIFDLSTVEELRIQYA